MIMIFHEWVLLGGGGRRRGIRGWKGGGGGGDGDLDMDMS